jgi:hypothetical protein
MSVKLNTKLKAVEQTQAELKSVAGKDVYQELQARLGEKAQPQGQQRTLWGQRTRMLARG